MAAWVVRDGEEEVARRPADGFETALPLEDAGEDFTVAALDGPGEILAEAPVRS